jgi:hypothetical protein
MKAMRAIIAVVMIDMMVFETISDAAARGSIPALTCANPSPRCADSRVVINGNVLAFNRSDGAGKLALVQHNRSA